MTSGTRLRTRREMKDVHFHTSTSLTLADKQERRPIRPRLFKSSPGKAVHRKTISRTPSSTNTITFSTTRRGSRTDRPSDGREDVFVNEPYRRTSTSEIPCLPSVNPRNSKSLDYHYRSVEDPNLSLLQHERILNYLHGGTDSCYRRSSGADASRYFLEDSNSSCSSVEFVREKMRSQKSQQQATLARYKILRPIQKCPMHDSEGKRIYNASDPLDVADMMASTLIEINSEATCGGGSEDLRLYTLMRIMIEVSEILDHTNVDIEDENAVSDAAEEQRKEIKYEECVKLLVIILLLTLYMCHKGYYLNMSSIELHTPQEEVLNKKKLFNDWFGYI